jgi:hypothetical protein
MCGGELGLAREPDRPIIVAVPTRSSYTERRRLWCRPRVYSSAGALCTGAPVWPMLPTPVAISITATRRGSNHPQVRRRHRLSLLVSGGKALSLRNPRFCVGEGRETVCFPDEIAEPGDPDLVRLPVLKNLVGRVVRCAGHQLTHGIRKRRTYSRCASQASGTV